MTTKRFKATVVAGHKEDAVEVPFDPSVEWKVRPEAIRSGRRGYSVAAKISGVAFESFVVARSKRFWLLLPTEIEQAINIGEGDAVSVAISPLGR